MTYFENQLLYKTGFSLILFFLLLLYIDFCYTLSVGLVFLFTLQFLVLVFVTLLLNQMGLEGND